MNKDMNIISYPDYYEASGLNLRLDVAFTDLVGSTSEGAALKVVAGTAGTWTIRVTNMEHDFPEGTIFHLTSLNYQFAYKLQHEHKQRRDYTSLEKHSSAEFGFRATGGSKRQLCEVWVQSGTFRMGESFTIRIGDRRFGSVGCEVYWTAGEAALLLSCCPAGSGIFKGVLGNPHRFEVIADREPGLVRLLGPTVAVPGQPFRMSLGVFDRNGNVIENYSGIVQIGKPPELTGLPDIAEIVPENKGNLLFHDVSINTPGVYRIKASTENGLKSLSNPIVVENHPRTSIFWGDIHCHGWGDCTMYLMHLRTAKLDPLSRHLQARDIGRLDFAAPGPMSFPRADRDGIWEAYRHAVEQMDVPGEYVPFLSYEAHPPGVVGDRNIIFKGKGEPLPPDYGIPMQEVERMYGERDDVILQVHIGGQTPKWDNYRTRRERMLEISSGFGNAEWLLREALKRGYRPAVCGCSDLHMGLLGGPRSVETFRGRFQKVMKQRDSAYGTGPLTALYAGEVSRDSLWQAMTARQTYATSGARMYLLFECNGQLSGSVLPKNGPVKGKLKCHGTELIDKIEIICGEYTIQSWSPQSMDFIGEWEWKAEELPGDWLYARIHQVDENYAWSSPVWFEANYPRWDDANVDLQSCNDEGAAKYMNDLRRYLELEEDAEHFRELRPVGIIRQINASCALFYCYYGKGRKMSIRWYYEFDIPKVRFDWGWRNFGAADDMTDEYLY